MLRKIFYLLAFVFVNLNYISAQCTTTTVNVDLSGACSFAYGSNVCASDFRCYSNTTSNCNYFSAPTNVFSDPVPPGNIVVGAQVNFYYTANCASSGSSISFACTLNGVSLGSANLTAGSCLLNGECFTASTPNNVFNCGIGSYNYGGNNNFATTIVGSGAACVDRYEIVLCYRSSIPNAGTAASTATALCSGQSATLTLTGYQTGGTIQWQSAPTSGGPWTNIPGATSATYATGVLSSNTCYRAQVVCNGTNFSNVVCITVNPLPTVSVSSNTICSGQSGSLNSTVSLGGGTYMWTPGAYTTPNITVSPTSTQVYNLTYTDPNGCVGTGSGTMFVNPSPTVTVNNATLCAGQSATLIASGNPSGGTYSWSPSGNTSNTEVVTPIITSNYTVQYITGPGCPGTAVANVVVNPIPLVTVTNGTICGTGGSATLTSNVFPSGGTYVWMPGGLGSPSIIVSPSSTSTYTLTYTSPAGCTNTAVATAYVSSLPSVAANSATICNQPGSSAVLSATVSPPGGSFVWNPGPLSGPMVVVSPSTTTTYTLAYTEPGGCTNYTTANVVVLPGFNSADFSFPFHPCFDSQPIVFTSTVVGVGPYAYQWYFGNGSSPSTASTPTASVNYIYPGTKSISFVVINTSSGCKDSMNKELYLEPLPNVNFSASSPNCVMDSVKFTNYSWISGSGVIAGYYWDFGDGNNSNLFEPSHMYSSGGTYTVMLVVTSDYGCDDTLYKVVNVSPATVPGNVTASDTVCATSNSGTLTINSYTGSIVYWMFSTDNGNTWIPIASTNSVYTYNNLSQTTIYGALVQSGSCPSATTSPNATITVDPATVPGYIHKDTLVCYPINQGTLSIRNYSGSIVGWVNSTDNGMTWNNMSYTLPTYTFSNLIDTTWYKAYVKSGVCNLDSTPVTKVIVRWFNSAITVPADTTISMGFSVQLNSLGGYFYAWTPNYNISDTTIHNPSVWPNKDTTYFVYVTDKYGCTDVDTVHIFVKHDYKLVIANTMTPNGDNYNDIFWIGMIEYYPNNEVIVFNRYGQEIFKGTNYDNKRVFWDGTYNGNKVPDGAYYYVIKFTDSNTIFKGSINVIGSH